MQSKYQEHLSHQALSFPGSVSGLVCLGSSVSMLCCVKFMAWCKILKQEFDLLFADSADRKICREHEEGSQLIFVAVGELALWQLTSVASACACHCNSQRTKCLKQPVCGSVPVHKY